MTKCASVLFKALHTHTHSKRKCSFSVLNISSFKRYSSLIFKLANRRRHKLKYEGKYISIDLYRKCFLVCRKTRSSGFHNIAIKTMLPGQRTGPILIFLDNGPCLRAGKYINRLRRLFCAFNFFSLVLLCCLFLFCFVLFFSQKLVKYCKKVTGTGNE